MLPPLLFNVFSTAPSLSVVLARFSKGSENHDNVVHLERKGMDEKTATPLEHVRRAARDMPPVVVSGSVPKSKLPD